VRVGGRRDEFIKVPDVFDKSARQAGDVRCGEALLIF
jgi:hypothetical protein